VTFDSKLKLLQSKLKLTDKATHTVLSLRLRNTKVNSTTLSISFQKILLND